MEHHFQGIAALRPSENLCDLSAPSRPLRASSRPTAFAGAVYITTAPFWRRDDAFETQEFCEETEDRARDATFEGVSGRKESYALERDSVPSPAQPNAEQQSGEERRGPCALPALPSPAGSADSCPSLEQRLGASIASAEPSTVLAFQASPPYEPLEDFEVPWPCATDEAPGLDVGSGRVLFTCDGDAGSGAFVFAIDGFTREVAWVWRSDETDPIQDFASLVLQERWEDMLLEEKDAPFWQQQRAYAPLAFSGTGHVIWSGRSMLACIDVISGTLLWQKREYLLSEPLASSSSVLVSFRDGYVREYDIWTGRPARGSLPDATNPSACCGVNNPSCAKLKPFFRPQLACQQDAVPCSNDRQCPKLPDHRCATDLGVCVQRPPDLVYAEGWCHHYEHLTPELDSSYNGNFRLPATTARSRELAHGSLEQALQRNISSSHSTVTWELHGRILESAGVHVSTFVCDKHVKVLIADIEGDLLYVFEGDWTSSFRAPFIAPSIKDNVVYVSIGDRIFWYDIAAGTASDAAAANVTLDFMASSDGDADGDCTPTIPQVTQWGSTSHVGDCVLAIGTFLRLPMASDPTQDGTPAPVVSTPALMCMTPVAAPAEVYSAAASVPDSAAQASRRLLGITASEMEDPCRWGAGYAETDPNLSGDFSNVARLTPANASTFCHVYPDFQFVKRGPGVIPGAGLTLGQLLGVAAGACVVAACALVVLRFLFLCCREHVRRPASARKEPEEQRRSQRRVDLVYLHMDTLPSGETTASTEIKISTLPTEARSVLGSSASVRATCSAERSYINCVSQQMFPEEHNLNPPSTMGGLRSLSAMRSMSGHRRKLLPSDPAAVLRIERVIECTDEVTATADEGDSAMEARELTRQVSSVSTRASAVVRFHDSEWDHEVLIHQLNVQREQERPLAGRFNLWQSACVRGGQGMVAFASVNRESVTALQSQDGRTPRDDSLLQYSNVAIKFHFDRRTYEHEKQLIANQALVDAGCLPNILYASSDDANEEHVRSPCGRCWPAFFVLEKGLHLDEYIAEWALRMPLRRFVDEWTCLQVVMHLAEKLAVMHAAGLVHCDLKPTNTIFCSHWQVIDLGHAAWAGTRVPLALTLEYASPEQVQKYLMLLHKRNHSLDISQEDAEILVHPAMDVWALGLIAYRLLADPDNDPVMKLGKRAMWALLHGSHALPWETSTQYHRTSARFRLSHPQFGYWILRMLSRDPQQRPTMVEVIQGFQAVLNPGRASSVSV